ncbi:MAG: RNA polymerase sigma factor [Muribaculaceae bacterium]|nr:RNA polymerase sigma factor [Muribaculaceae bacterium]
MFVNKHKNIDEIIETNLNALVRFAYFRIGDRAEAEDIVYEAILRLLETYKKNKLGNIKSYLFRIVYNLCQDHWRHQLLETIPLENVDVPDNTEDLLDKEEIDRINRLLDDLPPNEAEIINMKVNDELSYVEMSHILDIPESTIKSRFYSGIKKLKQKYLTNNQ